MWIGEHILGERFKWLLGYEPPEEGFNSLAAWYWWKLVRMPKMFLENEEPDD